MANQNFITCIESEATHKGLFRKQVPSLGITEYGKKRNASYWRSFNSDTVGLQEANVVSSDGGYIIDDVYLTLIDSVVSDDTGVLYLREIKGADWDILAQSDPDVAFNALKSRAMIDESEEFMLEVADDSRYSVRLALSYNPNLTANACEVLFKNCKANENIILIKLHKAANAPLWIKEDTKKYIF